MQNLQDFPDCLLVKIFSYLNSRDLCLTSSVCKRWTRLSFDRDLWRFADLSPLVSFTDSFQKMIIKTRLAYVTRFVSWNLLFVDAELVDTVVKYCTRLDTIVLKGCKIKFNFDSDPVEGKTLESTSFASRNSSHIKCCDFRNMSGDLLIPENCIKDNAGHLEVLGLNQFISKDIQDFIVTSLTRLRILDLTECFWANDIFVQKMSLFCPDLESLSLSRCVNFSGNAMYFVTRNCPKLRTLILRRTKLRDEFIMPQKWPNAHIEELDISHCYGLDEDGISHVLDACSNLRYLRSAVTDAILRKLTSMCSAVEVLEIRRRYPVSIPKIKDLLSNCPNLKSLDISLTPIEASYFAQFLPYLGNLENISFAGHEILNTYQIVDLLAMHCPKLRAMCINYYHAHNDKLLQESILKLIQSCKLINRIAIQGLYVQNTLEELNSAIMALDARKKIDFSHPHRFSLPRPNLSLENVLLARKKRFHLR